MNFIIRDIIFDFSDTSFMDSSGIGLILRKGADRFIRLMEKYICLAGMKLIQKMLEMSGILECSYRFRHVLKK